MPKVEFTRAVNSGIVAEAYAVLDSKGYLHELVFENNVDELTLPAGESQLKVQLIGRGGAQSTVTAKDASQSTGMATRIPKRRNTIGLAHKFTVK